MQNIRAIMAKIQLPKKSHSMIIFRIKVRGTYRELGSQACLGCNMNNKEKKKRKKNSHPHPKKQHSNKK